MLFLCGLWGLNSGPQTSVASTLSPGLLPWSHLWVFTVLNVTKVTTLPKLTAVLLLTFGAITWLLLWSLNEAMPSSNFALCDVILPYVHFCCCDQMQHGENGLIWLPIPGFTPVLQWKLRQELEVGNQIHSPEWRETEWWEFEFSNLSALTQFRTPYLGNGATRSGWAFPSISRTSTQRHAHRPV